MEAAALSSSAASCSSFIAEHHQALLWAGPSSSSGSWGAPRTRSRTLKLSLSRAPTPTHITPPVLANGPSSASSTGDAADSTTNTDFTLQDITFQPQVKAQHPNSISSTTNTDFTLQPQVKSQHPNSISSTTINTTEHVIVIVKDAAAATSSISGVTGSRAGLFRTPISGGVHSATSAHDLPPPALAVRNLMEQARFAHLCTTMSKMHHRRAGYPFGSLVDFAPDSMGHPIFSLSPLAIHTRNLLADPRCTLVVQIPGWSGLSNARVTIFGDVVPLPADHQDWARQQYIAKHQQWASQQWGNFYYYRMQTISDIYFIGGFGTVAWLDVKEYEAIQPDKIAAIGGEQNLKELNAMFSKPLKELLSAEVEIDDAALISVDSKGTDIRVRQGAQFNIQRLSFEVDHGVETLEDAKRALQKIIKKGSKPKPHK